MIFKVRTWAKTQALLARARAHEADLARLVRSFGKVRTTLRLP